MHADRATAITSVDIFARDWWDMVQQGTGPDGALVVLAPWVAAAERRWAPQLLRLRNPGDGRPH